MANKEKLEGNEELVTLSVDIPYQLKDQLKFSSYKDKKPIKDIVRDAIEEYLKKQDGTE